MPDPRRSCLVEVLLEHHHQIGELLVALDCDALPRDLISRKLSVPNAERVFFIRHALRAGFTIEEIFNLTKIDRWFLTQIKEIVDFEEELAGTTC